MNTVYPLLEDELATALLLNEDQHFSRPFIKRVSLIVQGIVCGKEVTPARIARTLAGLGLCNCNPESAERTIRRIENDERLEQGLCVHPLARRHLAVAHTSALTLILDPTYMKDRLVVVMVAAWYRGQSLPLAWTVWPANTPLEGDRFWIRIEHLLEEVRKLMPSDKSITVLADRAFGTPAFTDVVQRLGWYFVVRVQQQTRYRGKNGRECSLGQLMHPFRRRGKGHGSVFKSRGWRELSVVVNWGQRHKSPLCLVSNLIPKWDLLAMYKHRYGIEALFRYMKSHGWNWEQSQVTSITHWDRLLTAMALATWLAICAGTRMIHFFLIEQGKDKRKSLKLFGANSLARWGLILLENFFHGRTNKSIAAGPASWQLEWDDQTWRQQIQNHDIHARIFA